MSQAPQATRDRIIETADQLFYQRGYAHTSFADIAAAVNLSRGNFYYHFKTKDEILAAVIELRQHKTRLMLDNWATQAQTPAERIERFIDMMAINSPQIRQYGCPVGTLCMELAKLEHPALANAGELLTLFRNWLAAQFEQLGLGQESGTMAMHLLARSQGIATIAHTFNDQAFILREIALLHEWLRNAVPPDSRST